MKRSSIVMAIAAVMMLGAGPALSTPTKPKPKPQNDYILQNPTAGTKAVKNFRVYGPAVQQAAHSFRMRAADARMARMVMRSRVEKHQTLLQDRLGMQRYLMAKGAKIGQDLRAGVPDAQQRLKDFRVEYATYDKNLKQPALAAIKSIEDATQDFAAKSDAAKASARAFKAVLDADHAANDVATPNARQLRASARQFPQRRPKLLDVAESMSPAAANADFMFHRRPLPVTPAAAGSTPAPVSLPPLPPTPNRPRGNTAP